MAALLLGIADRDLANRSLVLANVVTSAPGLIEETSGGVADGLWFGAEAAALVDATFVTEALAAGLVIGLADGQRLAKSIASGAGIGDSAVVSAIEVGPLGDRETLRRIQKSDNHVPMVANPPPGDEVGDATPEGMARAIGAWSTAASVGVRVFVVNHPVSARQAVDTIAAILEGQSPEVSTDG